MVSDRMKLGCPLYHHLDGPRSLRLPAIAVAILTLPASQMPVSHSTASTLHEPAQRVTVTGMLVGTATELLVRVCQSGGP
jgi:hypothetical protein